MSEPFEPVSRAAPQPGAESAAGRARTAGDAGAADTQPIDSAGAMLRAARQAQGLQLATLALMLKITPRKLEALEDDRYDELQGVTFTRALAQSACRVLKIDPAPVLARLPRAEQGTLGQAGGGLNEPFRERALRRDPLELLSAGRGVLAVVAVLLVAAAALWLAPPGFGLASLPSINWPSIDIASAPDDPASAAATADAGAAAGIDTALPPELNIPADPARSAAGPTTVGVPAAAAPESASEPLNGLAMSTETAAAVIPVQLRVREESWIEVLDAKGESLLARTLAPGEAVGLDGVMPVRVKIGNAAATELTFRGHPVDLAPVTRDNVARIELK